MRPVVALAWGSELGSSERKTLIVDALSKIWSVTTLPFTKTEPANIPSLEEQLRDLVAKSTDGETVVGKGLNPEGGAIFTVTTPIMAGGQSVGVVALASASGEIDTVSEERTRTCVANVLDRDFGVDWSQPCSGIDDLKPAFRSRDGSGSWAQK